MLITEDVAEALMKMEWVVAAEVVAATADFGFVPSGLFFPVAHNSGDEWAAEFGMDEIPWASFLEPYDWMAREESSLKLPPGSYPSSPGSSQFWRQLTSGKCYVTLEVNAREFAIVRQMAAVARKRGLLPLIADEALSYGAVSTPN
ncbi:hypothetical protein PQR02_26535 [Paraburkholderia sediminicola]|uniref:Uncharacterized protein n=1 Tax=Paraburkholderia rhynchosiae TaxID=487049 RepID=A0ACC7NEM9_9BURK